jgi:acyl-CoA synthetase (AMP-forming)/AMP-acid ligase II
MDPLKQVTNTVQSLATLTEAGIIHLQRPDRALRTALTLIRWGVTPAAGYESSAVQYPDEVALIDELGQLTFREVSERTNALAHALADDGVNEGDSVAIMARNHRGFIDAVVACSKLGAHALFMNTSFSGPQLTDVADREKPKAIVYDEEFSEVLEDAGRRRKRYIAWAEPDAETKDPTLEELIERGDPSPVIPPKESGKAVILTSGTTGTPKGASRSQPKSLDPVAALLSRIPLKAREKTMIAAPLFHAWGFAHFTLALGLSSTIVLRRKFDPEGTLSATAQHGCTALVVVPVMLQRILDLEDDVLDRYDLSTVKAVPVSGSALPAALSERWMDHFGENLYNLYGSTEVAWATIASPKDLREAPGTSGLPPRGTIVKIYDDDGNEVEPGDTGRIFVGNDLQFEGYTGGGGNKDVIDGLMSSGDVGHFDDEGRLFIDGRDDDMIVSGGENVFPQEVEDLLSGHESISEAAVFGIDDEEFGQRLKAVVVTKGSKQLSEDDVKKFVKSNLAGYKVPKEVEFIDELPRTSTGKVLKRELKDDGDGDGDDGGENGKSDGKKGSGESAEEASGGGKKKPAEKG